MAVNVFGYRVSVLVVIAALLQIVTVLCATESIWGPNSRTRQVTKYVLFGIIGVMVAVLLERFFVVPSEYTLVVSLGTGASSGITGGYLGQWFQEIADASHLYQPTFDSLVTLTVARGDVKRKIRISSQQKQTLARRRREIQDDIRRLEAVENVKTGRAKRERELISLMKDLKELDKLTDRNSRSLRLHQERLEELDAEIDVKSKQAASYKRTQAHVESLLTIRRLGVDYLVFGLVAVVIVAAAFLVGIPILIALPIAFLVFMALRQIGMVIKASATIATALNLDGPRVFGFSWKHFLIGFLPMLVLQLSLWLVPTPSWAQATFAFVLAVGGGLASSFALPVDRLVKSLTREQLGLVELGCIIAGIVLSVFRSS